MSGKRGAYAKSAVRKRKLSEATLALVIERGHRAVTTADIAERAGVSEPSLFYHFPSKEALLVAALQEFDDQHIRSPGQPGAIADMGARAEAGVQRENILRLHTEMSGASVDPDHPAHDYFRDRWERSRDVMAYDIRRLQNEGVVSGAVDPERAARALLAVWEGLQLEWLSDPVFNIREELQAVAADILRTNAVTRSKLSEAEEKSSG